MSCDERIVGGSKNPCVDADAVWRGLKWLGCGGQGSQCSSPLVLDHGNVAKPCIFPMTPMLLQAGIEGYKQIHSRDKRKPRISRCDRAMPRS